MYFCINNVVYFLEDHVYNLQINCKWLCLQLSIINAPYIGPNHLKQDCFFSMTLITCLKLSIAMLLWNVESTSQEKVDLYHHVSIILYNINTHNYTVSELNNARILKATGLLDRLFKILLVYSSWSLNIGCFAFIYLSYTNIAMLSPKSKAKLWKLAN